MNIAQVEENVKSLLAGLVAGQVKQPDFIYELLLAYGFRKSVVPRIRSGERNMASKDNKPLHTNVIVKTKLYYKQVEGNALHSEIDQMCKEKLVTTNKIRFVIVTNFDQLLAYDLKTNDSLDINFDELPGKFDFFLPWAGMEKAVYQGENPADIKAAEKMAKLFDLIKSDNFDESNKDDTVALHNLNVFLTRLLFCFFAEDTEIFTDNQFSLGVESHTKEDGSDLSDYLNRLFTVLDTADSDRSKLPNAPLPQYLANFPYVNGGLFTDDIPSPSFSVKSRSMLIECGSELDWSDINPDIFGSMIQAVVHPDQRGGMGMHYTSVTNIMKVIEPLFLNDLYEELEKVENSGNKLKELQQRLGAIKIFDPACGSGNFLIIAYKELRKLEMEVLKRFQEQEAERTGGQISKPFSVVKLSQFYGVELDDFAHEVAVLSLWLAEHQMNVEFKAEFGDSSASLPLERSGSIKCGNAVIIDWQSICDPKGEVYVMGNPPYLGARLQNKEQKDDVQEVFGNLSGAKNLDYISCWFYQAAKYIEHGVKAAFVSTNSIVQGEQVSILWPSIFDFGVDISFAHLPFRWANSARNNAAVTCVIIGLSAKGDCKEKYIYNDNHFRSVSSISPYLYEGSDNVVEKRSKPIADIPLITFGNMPNDGGNLILDDAEKASLISNYPDSKKYFKKLIGSRDFINGGNRWCLWLEDDSYKEIEPIVERVGMVKSHRLSSSRAATQNLASIPNSFGEIRHKSGPSIIIPRHSSERREYIPSGYLFNNEIIHDSAMAIYSATPFVFGIISSRLHTLWVATVGGRIKTDYRYSAAICYNTFPMPNCNEARQAAIEKAALQVLSERESFPEKTLAQLYNPETMPPRLLSAHSDLDIAVENVFSRQILSSDGERIQCLLRNYEKMTGGQNA